MKKLLLLVGTFFAVNSLPAMEKRYAVFSTENIGVDISDRQAVIDFYWKKKYEFEVSFVKAKADAPYLSRSEAQKLFNDLIQKAEQAGADSERDLNRDTFARIFEAFVDELTTYRASQYPEQEDPKMRSKKI
jgi:hypothetical protein